MSVSTTTPSRRRSRLGVLSLLLVGSLATTAITATGGAAVSAVPTDPCPRADPVGNIHAGDAVDGLTVSHGTVPDSFSGTVLGVLDDAIAPGVPLVMVRLSNPDIDRFGIWQGMSGSPVYAADGSLIGAVAYSLATGPSPVAGVTPYEDMTGWLPTPPVRVGAAAARTVARAAGVGRAAAARGFTALPTPLAVSGIGAGRLAALARRSAAHPWVSRAVRRGVPMGTAPAGAGGPGASSIVPGGNLAATLSYGQVSMSALGTATAVCGDDVVGFGHPVLSAGRTTLGLSPADALYVQDDVFDAFKVANVGAPVGTITQDRLTGDTGTLGPLPTTADVTSAFTSGNRSHEGLSHVVRRTPNNVATTTLLQVLGDHQAVLQGPARGTEDASWTIAGTAPDGSPFSLDTGDLFSANHDLGWPVGFAIGDMVYRLDRIPGVSVDAVTTAEELSDGVHLADLQAVQVRQRGAWVDLTPRRALTARAGRALDLRLVLASATSGATSTVGAVLNVPRAYSGRLAALVVAAGGSARSGRPPRTFPDFVTWVRDRVRNDEVRLTLSRGSKGAVAVGGGSSGTGVAEPVRPAGAAPGRVSTVVGPLGSVVRGSRFGLIAVR